MQMDVRLLVSNFNIPTLYKSETNFLAFDSVKIVNINIRVKSGIFGHQVNSDTYLQTVKIQMRWHLKSHLIRIFTVCLVNLFFISIIELRYRLVGCPNLAVCPNIPNFTLLTTI